jgi:hypothetical protein
LEQLTAVKSSNIRAYGYAPEAQKLTIEFNNGTRWAYDGVPPDVAEGFASSESKGSFFSKSIRMAFPGTHVGNAEAES